MIIITGTYLRYHVLKVLMYCHLIFYVTFPSCFPYVSPYLCLCPLTNAALTATYIWAMIWYIRRFEHMVMKLILEYDKRIWGSKNYIAISGHYIFSILEFIHYIEQVIFKLMLKENNTTQCPICLFSKLAKHFHVNWE